MSDRIAVVSEGRVLQVDTPERLYERPTSRAVADFIGTMNFVQGRVRDTANGVVTVQTEALGEVQGQAGSMSSQCWRWASAAPKERVIPAPPRQLNSFTPGSGSSSRMM